MEEKATKSRRSTLKCKSEAKQTQQWCWQSKSADAASVQALNGNTRGNGENVITCTLSGAQCGDQVIKAVLKSSSESITEDLKGQLLLSTFAGDMFSSVCITSQCNSTIFHNKVCYRSWIVLLNMWKKCFDIYNCHKHYRSSTGLLFLA